MNRFPYPRFCVVLVLLAAACSKGDAPRADSPGAGATASNAPVTSATLRSAVKALPGALSKPLDSYTGDELYALVHGLSFTGDSVRERNCKNDPSCVSAPKQKKVKVGVAAVVGQDSLSAGTTPQYGVVYVRATNKGDAQESRYGMKAGKNLEYYVVVLPDSGGKMKWRLEQLDTRAGARQHASIGTGMFNECSGHRWTRGARADFKTCASAAAAHDPVAKLGLLQQASDEDPMWVACAAGCCTAGNT